MGKIELKSKILNDKYTEYIYDKFDIQNNKESNFTVNFDFSLGREFDWRIGVIYGGSGSGKSTLLKKLGKGEIKKATFDKDKALISNFDWLEPSEATRLLSSMGLSSVPTWLRPFHTLSNGEQYRAELSCLVASAKDGEVILIDEYTSVVDRDVAKAMSFALQKYIRKHNKRIIVASCHTDILEWLNPCWVCSPQEGGVLKRYQPQNAREGETESFLRPNIELQIHRVEPHTWNLFKNHHYLTEDLNPSCQCFLFTWGETPVGFVGAINQPSNHDSTAMRGSRIVILPELQGLGMGAKMIEFVASLYKSVGKNFYSKTVHPALGEYRNKSPLWSPTAFNGKVRKVDDPKAKNRVTRMSYCHKYVGEPTYGAEDLIKPISEMRLTKYISKLF